MCGLAGFITTDGKAPNLTERQLKKMLAQASFRGKDATGIFWLGTDSDSVFKLPIEAKHFIKRVPWNEVLKASVCLMHTRHATQGSTSILSNNHPILSRDRNLVLTHNGIVGNSDDYVHSNIVDSMAIIEAYEIEKGKKDSMVQGMMKAIRKLYGSLTFAMFDRKAERLILVKSDNPLYFGFKGNTIVWGSTKMTVKHAKPEYIVMAANDCIYSIKGKHFRSYNIKQKEKPKTVHNNVYDWRTGGKINMAKRAKYKRKGGDTYATKKGIGSRFCEIY